MLFLEWVDSPTLSTCDEDQLRMLRPAAAPETEAAEGVVVTDMEAAPVPPVITPDDEDTIDGSFSAIPSPWSTFRQFITRLFIWGVRSKVRASAIQDHSFICDTTHSLSHYDDTTRLT